MAMGPDHVRGDESVERVDVHPRSAGVGRQAAGQIVIGPAEGVDRYVGKGQQRHATARLAEISPHLHNAVHGSLGLATTSASDDAKRHHRRVDDALLLRGEAAHEADVAAALQTCLMASFM
ncbi:hypothetical protein D3C85_1517300 [compost metagenome]